MADRIALQDQVRLAQHLHDANCSQISLGVDDSLLIDFGDLESASDGQLTGMFVLAIECPWRIDGRDRPVAGWDDHEEDIFDQATILIGASITKVEVREPGFDLILFFSNGYQLRIFPDCRAYYHEELSGGVIPWQVLGRGIPSRQP